MFFEITLHRLYSPFIPYVFIEKVFYFNKIILYKLRREIENSRGYDICRFDVHRASNAKKLGNKKHLENEKQEEMIISEGFFKEFFEKKIKIYIYTPKPIKQIARENFKINVKQLYKELSKKMTNASVLLIEHYKSDLILLWIVIIFVMLILKYLSNQVFPNFEKKFDIKINS